MNVPMCNNDFNVHQLVLQLSNIILIKITSTLPLKTILRRSTLIKVIKGGVSKKRYFRY